MNLLHHLLFIDSPNTFVIEMNPDPRIPFLRMGAI